MFEIFIGAKYRFMARRKIAYLISGTLMLASAISLIAHGGPKESIDFTGGNLLYVEFDRAVPVGEVREAVRAARMESAEVQMAQENTQAILRFRAAPGDKTNYFSAFQGEMQKRAGNPAVTLLSLETVGPKIGKELEQKAGLAILWSLILILGYVAWRFKRISFGLGAVIALFHDVFITLGVFSVLGLEVDLTVVAALLTIGGYSINDTIVVFDRIRENMGLLKRMSFSDLIDKSVNQTLSRTILTSGVTLLTVVALFFLGGVVIHHFALAILIGFVIGTYSSIFVASSLGLDFANWWIRRKTAKAHQAPAKAAATP